MEKAMINRLTKRMILCIFIVVTIFASVTATVNADGGSVRIVLKSHKTLGSVNNVEFSVYKVGEVETATDTPVFDSSYGITNTLKTAADMQNAIEIIKKANKPARIIKGSTSSDGILDLSLERGVYYIEAGKNDYGIIKPMLVWLPYFDEITMDMSNSVTIEPKAEPNTSVEGEEGYPKTTPVAVDKPSGSQVKGEQAKTNDSFFSIILGILILSVAMMIIILISRKKETNNAR